MTVIDLPRVRPHKSARHRGWCDSARWYKTLCARQAGSLVPSSTHAHRATALGLNSAHINGDRRFMEQVACTTLSRCFWKYSAHERYPTVLFMLFPNIRMHHRAIFTADMRVLALPHLESTSPSWLAYPTATPDRMRQCVP